MQSMRCGKASTHFFERALELENIVLKNQAFQTTRFVRSLQRGITAALRNLPTIVSLIAEEYQEAAPGIKRLAHIKNKSIFMRGSTQIKI